MPSLGADPEACFQYASIALSSANVEHGADSRVPVTAERHQPGAHPPRPTPTTMLVRMAVRHSMIRIIHNLGGSGGTLLSRCLGVLPKVALFSEINPLSVNLFAPFHPLHQDREWAHVLNDQDREQLAGLDFGEASNFRRLIERLYSRCSESGRHLILRDYNFVEFVGVPFLATPPCRRDIYAALPLHVRHAAAAFLRHPVDQWASLCKHAQVASVLRPAAFVRAYAAFLDDLRGVPTFRYEDFVREPSAELRRMCAVLQLEFDPSFISKFAGFDGVTGDFTRHSEKQISLPPPKHLPEAAIEEFRTAPDFDRILALGGYALDEDGSKYEWTPSD